MNNGTADYYDELITKAKAFDTIKKNIRLIKAIKPYDHSEEYFLNGINTEVTEYEYKLINEALNWEEEDD